MTSNLKVNNILPSTGNTVAVSGIASVTSSVSIASSCTATTFHGSGANLTSLPAANLTGTLPAISGANLTNLPVPTTITVADESSDTTCNPLFVTTTSGNLAPKTGTNLTFNSSSGNLRTGSLFLGTGSNESKTQDGLILERNSGDGEVHITAGRSGGNYSGLQFYVAGGSGVTKRHQIDYQSNFRWFHSNGTTERFKIEQNGTLTSTASNNGQIIHSFKNTDTTAGSSAHTIEHWFRFNRSGGGMDSPAAKIIAGKEREWIGGAANQDGYLAFHTMLNESSSEKMRLTSNGALLINSTSQGSDELFKIFTSSTGPEMIQLRNNSGGTKDMITMMNVNNSGSVMIRFKQTGGLSNVGSITTSSNSTSYNTSSDYRLKENEVLISDGITRLKTLKPYRFNFKTDPTKTVDGFFAHEVTAVPEAVHGEKDAVETTYYAEGDTIPEGKAIGDIKEENIVLPQSLDYAKITPLLTAALQEAIAKIEILEAKVAALEGS